MMLAGLFLSFLKIGAFTFGGGYAMLPLIRETVLEHGWLEEKVLIDFIAVSESTPGPFAVNMATFVGAHIGGVAGACLATLGVVLPSFLIILAVARCYEAFRKSRIVKGCMYGLKSAVVGLIASAVLSVGKAVFFSSGISLPAMHEPVFLLSVLIFVPAVILAFKKVHPIRIICLSALLGIIGGFAAGI